MGIVSLSLLVGLTVVLEFFVVVVNVEFSVDTADFPWEPVVSFLSACPSTTVVGLGFVCSPVMFVYFRLCVVVTFFTCFIVVTDVVDSSKGHYRVK